ncbi:hypothetical protein RIR_jg20939.t1 [Rhizophagus irregularis DAOM 181602=DAOM 197198]|nr:hypothetical protein RIR_jg20939.t1 [Rhizophagus irregularis DAOM 181602=DAOM 197198]
MISLDIFISQQSHINSVIEMPISEKLSIDTRYCMLICYVCYVVDTYFLRSGLSTEYMEPKMRYYLH